MADALAGESALPDAPEELEAVLLKMMTRDVADRYQTPAEVVRALTPFAVVDVVSPSAGKPLETRFLPVAPELNDFLNQLGVAAARDEEIDTGTHELEKTQASRGVHPPRSERADNRVRSRNGRRG